MSEETYTFEQARARLEDISKQTKGASLEKCLDLLEEGVKLANVCTEKIDHTRWRDEVEETDPAGDSSPEASDDESDGTPAESGSDDAEVDDPEVGATEAEGEADAAEDAENDVVAEGESAPEDTDG